MILIFFSVCLLFVGGFKTTDLPAVVPTEQIVESAAPEAQTLPEPTQTAPTLQTDTTTDSFPTTAPKPPPSLTPPPHAPSGRWLMSLVMIESSAFAYGGVGSYSTALFNDLWVYNFVDQYWTELQASFVPPFPLPDRNKGIARLPNEPVEQFRPTDIPPVVAMRADPAEANELEALEKTIVSTTEQEALPVTAQPVSVVTYEPMPVSLLKQTGMDTDSTTFLELDSDEPCFLSLHEEMKLQTHAGLEVSEHARLRHRELMKRNNPPQFWKNPSLSPGLLSPFIAADLWEWDSDSKLWSNVKTKSPIVPAPRWLHTAVNIGNRMVIFGGVSYSDVILGDTWVFNPEALTWTKADPEGEVILPREGHSACIFNGNQMIVFGGISYGQLPFNDLWGYDATLNRWAYIKAKGELPPPRWLHTASVYTDVTGQEKMYVFGGVTRSWVPLNDLWVLDKVTLTWSHPRSLGFPPAPRFMHQSVILGTKLLVYAGVANNIPYEDMWEYDLLDEKWNEVPPTGALPLAREGHACASAIPPMSKFAPQFRKPYVPPIEEEPFIDPLTPLIKNFTVPRSADRYRKAPDQNRFWLCFGGAGPKPRDSD